MINHQTLLTIFLAASLFAGCGDSEDIQISCAGSFTHYYDVGCEYTNGLGEQIPVSEMIGVCQLARAQSGEACQPALDDWLVCSELADGTADGCDCNAEFDAVLRAGCAT